MPARARKSAGSNAIVWMVVASLAALIVVGGVASVGAYLLLRGKAAPLGLPGPVAPGADDTENTRARAEDAMRRLEDAGGRDADRVEKELKDSLLGKQFRWSFPVEAVDEGEVKLDSFFGTKAGRFGGGDAGLEGRPTRRLYLRVYFAGEKDVVKVGDEVTKAEAARLKKGDRVTITRTVSEVTLTRHDDGWVSTSAYTDVVDVLGPYCVTIILVRKP